MSGRKIMREIALARRDERETCFKVPKEEEVKNDR